ncbi:unnamed protein product, partial [marine sediment metagenome]
MVWTEAAAILLHMLSAQRRISAGGAQRMVWTPAYLYAATVA